MNADGAAETVVSGCPVVGVGASAGGLEAFQQFLNEVPDDGGIAYVLIQHIDPNYKSHLPELLQKWTSMAVAHVKDGDDLRPDHVYLAPPNAILKLDGHRIRLSEFEQPRGLRRPIDEFFQSLASAQEDNCACIVLSGTGSDGSAGLRAVREAGGLTIVQTPETAKYDGMPISAQATGLADHIAAIDRMPNLLMTFFGHWHKNDAGAPEALQDYVTTVCEVLRDQLGHDFSGYKRNTVIRRIARRIQVVGADSHEAYVRVLKSDVGECERLFHDLLINVTEFFRDREAFQALREQVIRPLVQSKSADQALRIWVPGCSSGEEAYSIAMLVRSEVQKTQKRLDVQIFATDIDERMLKVARKATYQDSIVGQVPDEFMSEYFVPIEGAYVLSSAIQDMVFFSAHNLLRDAPFSRLDLVSCRNTMIYLQPRLQQRVFPLFAYGLRPGGYLFLGSSEGLALEKDIFETIDLPARIWKKREGAPTRIADLGIDIDHTRARPIQRSHDFTREEGRIAEISRRMREVYGPPHVIIDSRGRIQYSSGRLGKFLDFPPGRPTNRLMDVARTSLKPQLRMTLEAARDSGKRQVRRNLIVRSDMGEQPIDLVIDPLEDGEHLVVFQDVDAFRAATEESVLTGVASEVESSTVEALEDEIDELREQLRNTVEELETSNEELKSSNEEMMSMNEELQSTNEELATVNDELKVKVDELADANADLQNLLNSTHVATIFIDKELRLRTFTPSAARLYRLKRHDRGRPLSDFSSRIEGIDLYREMVGVLETLESFEREITLADDEDDGIYVLRITPYRTLDDVVDGLVLTFTEITQLKSVQARLEESFNRYDAAAKASGQVFYEWEPQTGQIIYSGAVENLTGYTAEELEGGMDRLLQMVEPERRQEIRLAMTDAARDRQLMRMEFGLERKDGRTVTVENRARAFDTRPDRPTRVMGVLIDNTHRADLELSQRQLMGELQHRVKNILATVTSLVRQTGKNKTDKDEFEKALTQRIEALSRTHDLIVGGDRAKSDLATIIERETGPFLEGRADAIKIDGPQICLPPRHALALTLAVHELTTNAVKHGALSNGDGTVRISWNSAEDENGTIMALDWVEHGGPKVDGDGPRGFGRTLLERGLGHDLNGDVKLDFLPSGLKARILFRFEDATADG